MHSNNKNRPPYLSLSDSFSRELQQLKSNLRELSHGKPTKQILITSSRPGEGKTLAAISIAKTLAEGENIKVLLIDINFKSPVLHEVFNTAQSPGLADMVIGQTERENYCVNTSIPNLDLLPIGSPQSNTSWLYAANNFSTSLNSLTEYYDYIVADTNSFLGTSEVSMICPFFDTVLLVIECESTKWQVVKTTADKIENAGGNLLGTIMNRRKFYIPRFFY